MLERLGIHASVEAVFPPERLRDALDVDPTVVVVSTDRVDGCDALVSSRTRKRSWPRTWSGFTPSRPASTGSPSRHSASEASG